MSDMELDAVTAAPASADGIAVDAAGSEAAPPVLCKSELTGENRGQFGEVEVLVELLNYYGAENRWAVDVGAFDGEHLSNTAYLRSKGWNVVAVECEPGEAERCRNVVPPFHCVIEAKVTKDGPHSFDWVVGGVGPCPLDFDVLSLDIDGYDYHIWESFKSHRPRIVCIEIADFAGPWANGEYVPEYDKPFEVAKPPKGSPNDWLPYNRVTTLLSMSKLAKTKGYTLVAVTPCNAIYVRDDVIETRPIKLNLGAQGSFLPGFINIDAMSGDSVYPLRYADGSVSEIYASHILEHFSHRETLNVLREWLRVLEPGGRIRVAVPDWDKCVDPKEVPSFNMRQAYLFGGHSDSYDRHGALFTEQSLTAQLRFCGVEFVQRWESEIKDCASLPISLNLGGVKRKFTIKENPMVVAVISQPRLTFSEGSNCLHRALRAIANKAVFHGETKPPFLDDLVYCGGAYWEKYLTGGIKTAIGIGADLLLFTDYDSAFSPEDVLALLDIINKDPTVSAVFAVQASRHNDAALVQMEYVTYEGELTPVHLGHFGLTVIRAEVFRDLPMPWLWSMPNPVTGEWDTQGHCDADITFWRVLAEHGHKVVQANNIQAGHMILAVKWLTETGVAYQPIENYRKLGRPERAKFNAEAYRTGPEAVIPPGVAARLPGYTPPAPAEAAETTEAAPVDPALNGHGGG